MASNQDRRPDIVRALVLMALLPFVLLSLIAPGTMLAREPGSQRVMVVLCGSSLPVSMMVDAQGALVPAPAEAPHAHDAKPACGWALHGRAGLMSGEAPQLDSAAAFYPAYLPGAVAQYRRGFDAPAFLPRGPPVAV